MNEYRCKTCHNEKCIWNHENPHAYSGVFPHRRLTLGSLWVNNFMERVGCVSHSKFKDERHKLDADTIGTILNVMEKDFDKLTMMERHAYNKAKSVELYLREQEAHV